MRIFISAKESNPTFLPMTYASKSSMSMKTSSFFSFFAREMCHTKWKKMVIIRKIKTIFFSTVDSSHHTNIALTWLTKRAKTFEFFGNWWIPLEKCITAKWQRGVSPEYGPRINPCACKPHCSLPTSCSKGQLLDTSKLYLDDHKIFIKGTLVYMPRKTSSVEISSSVKKKKYDLALGIYFPNNHRKLSPFLHFSAWKCYCTKPISWNLIFAIFTFSSKNRLTNMP